MEPAGAISTGVLLSGGRFANGIGASLPSA
jgi:hypothetical protein